jgi:hypothetical protein
LIIQNEFKFAFFQEFLHWNLHPLPERSSLNNGLWQKHPSDKTTASRSTDQYGAAWNLSSAMDVHHQAAPMPPV